MIKGSIPQEGIIILNVYAYNRASQCINLKLIKLKGEIDRCTLIVGDFNTFFLRTDR